MPERASYTPGTPCWVDIATPETDATSAFYGELFGWEVRVLDETSDYSIAYLNGRAVAGLGRTVSAGRPWWTSYFAVPDADACVKVATQTGALVLDGPHDILSRGRTAMLSDPAGAVFALWQAGAFPGAGLVNEPGSFCWNELAVRDAAAAADFYRAVFGWEGRSSWFAENTSTYTEFLCDGEIVAGMVQMNDEWPPEIPAHWMVYFTVADCDDAAAAVEELGGAVSIPPFDIESGRIAVADDPHGAVFSIIQLT